MAPYLTFNTCSELLCFLCASAFLYKDRDRVWKSLVWYLLVICITEFTGIYIKLNGQHNSWIYNLLLVIEIGIISLLFQHLLSQYFNSKTLIRAGVLLLYCIYLYELSSHGLGKRNYWTNITLGVMAIVYSLLFIYHLLKADDYINLHRSFAFWWVFGTFVYYFGDTTLNVFYPVLSKILVKPNDVFAYIYKALNVIQYACWSYAFYCRKWSLTTKLSS